MQSIPDYISEVARTGRFLYLVEILPKGSDSWSAFRWGEKGVTVDGNVYEGGYIVSIGNITHRADIVEGGGAATIDAVSVKLADKTSGGIRMTRELIDNDVEGRDINIYMIADPPNELQNASFEDYTGSDFDYWTETPGDGTISFATSDKYHGATMCFINWTAGSTAPILLSDACPTNLKRGQGVTFSFWHKASAFRTFGWDLKVGSKYWNPDTSTFNASPVKKIINIFNVWGRHSVHLPPEIWDDVHLSAVDSVSVQARFEPPGTSAQLAYVDAVQIEYGDGGPPTPFQVHRDNLVAADLLQVYTGEVRNHPWKLGKIQIETEQIYGRRHRDIPITRITSEIDSGWTIPPEVVGKPFPMTYGDLFQGNGVDELGVLPTHPVAHGRICNFEHTAAEDLVAHFDRPGMKLNQVGEIFHFDSDSRQYIRERYDDAASPDFVDYEWSKAADNGGKCTPDASGGFLTQGRAPLSWYVRGRNVYSNGGTLTNDFTNPENVYSGTAGAATHVTVGAETGGAQVGIDLAPLTLRDAEIYKAFYICWVHIIKTAGLFDIKMRPSRIGPVTYTTAAQTIFTLAASPASASGTFNNCPWSGSAIEKETAVEVLKDVTSKQISFWASGGLDMKYFVETWPTSGNGTTSVWEIAVRLDLSIDVLEMDFAGSVKGREFQDTWGSRKTAGLLAESPAEVIESILRDELGISGSDIRTGNFDTVHTAESGAGQDCAGQVLKVQDSLDVIAEICESHGDLYLLDYTGKESLVKLAHGAAVKTLTARDFKKDSVLCGYTPRKDIVNDFTLHYDYNPSLDEYTSLAYCNKDANSISSSAYQTKCDDSYTALGDQVFAKEWSSKWINSSLTAKIVVKFLVDWTSQKRLQLTGEVWLDNLTLELGDLVAVANLPELPNYVSTDVVFMVHHIAIQKSKKTLKVKLLEVKEP